MSLTVTEAAAVNTLLKWLLAPRRLPERPSEEDARKAAVLLAEHAHNKLYAGMMAADVNEAWTIEVKPKLNRRGR